MQQLAPRLQASAALLTALRGTPGFNDVSESEAEALVETIAPLELSPADVTATIQEVRRLGLARDDEIVVLKALSKKLAGNRRKPPTRSSSGLSLGSAAASTAAPAPAAPKPAAPEPAAPVECIAPPMGQSKVQNFEAIVNYWPKDVWDSMSQGVSAPALKFAVKLGLRNPSEKTSHAIALAIMASADGAEMVLQQPRAMTVSFCNSVKVWIANEVKLVGNPAVWLAKLMPSPQELRAHFPSVYDGAYVDGSVPVRNQIPMTVWEGLKANTYCRKDKSGGVQGPETQAMRSLAMQLQAVQAQMANGQPWAFNHRFANQPMLEDGIRLSNGALLDILKPTGRAAANASPIKPDQHAEQAGAGPAATPPVDEAKRPRMSVDDATKSILAGLAKKPKTDEGNSDVGSDEEVGNTTTGLAKKGGAALAAVTPKKKPATQGKKKDNGEPKVRYEDTPAEKFFACFYNKMRIKKFPYAKDTKKKSERAAKDWCKGMCEKHGWKTPATWQ